MLLDSIPKGTINLGLIQAIHAGINPPLNKRILWFDEIALVHKAYDFQTETWEPIGDGQIDVVVAIQNTIKSNSTFTGSRNGINKDFILPDSFFPNSTQVYINGVRQMIGTGNDYIEIEPNQITFSEAPDSTDNLIFDYIKI